jgi:hypothetical protein
MPKKNPTIPWSIYQKRLPIIGEEITLSDGRTTTLTFNGAIALICGKISGGIEVIDFDVKHDATIVERFQEVCGDFWQEVGPLMTIQKTVSGGCHLFYKCDTIEGNQKLANKKKNDTDKTSESLIETRGEGGYVAIAPTPGYSLLQGDLRSINTITAAQREQLLEYARMLNEFFEPVAPPRTALATQADTGERPGDHYNRDKDAIPALLEKHGWTLKKTLPNQQLWKRPGTTDSKWSGSFSPEHNTFYVYTSSVAALQPLKAYSPFALLTSLEHNGSWSEAASALYHKGFGPRHERQLQVSPPPPEPPDTHEPDDDGRDDARPLSKLERLENWMRDAYEFRRNIISDTITCMDRTLGVWKPCKDADIWRDAHHNLHTMGLKNVAISDISNILDSDFVPDYNPFQEYFQSLPPWDGKDHIQRFADHIQTDDQVFWSAQLKKALVRSLACTLDNVVNRIVMVLVQEAQESGKSTAIRFLCPPELQAYYKEEPMTHDKDGEIALSENFMWNLEELDELNKKQISDMKAIISRQSIKQRRAYDRREKHMPRIVNFWGSTNKAEFLTDTQNTRWLCFNVISISHDYNNTQTGTKNVDIHQLWAQAYHLYRNNFNYNLSNEDRKLRDTRNQSFEAATPEKQIILRHFRQAHHSNPGAQFLPTVEIHAQILAKTHARIQISEHNIGRAMKQLGFTSTQRRVDGKPMRGYWVISLTNPRDFDADGQTTNPPLFNSDENPF